MAGAINAPTGMGGSGMDGHNEPAYRPYLAKLRPLLAERDATRVQLHRPVANLIGPCAPLLSRGGGSGKFFHFFNPPSSDRVKPPPPPTPLGEKQAVVDLPPPAMV